MSSSSQNDASKPESPSRLSRRYKSLEREAKRYLDTNTTNGWSRRARAYTPSLEELSATPFCDYVRYTVLQCGFDKKDSNENDSRMHTRNYCPPGKVVALSRASRRNYADFRPPPCWSDGMAKVTHPEGWWDQAGIGKDPTARGPKWQRGTKLGDMIVESPIKQCVSGIGGVYEYTLMEMPSASVSEFRQQADDYRKRQIKDAFQTDFSDDACDELARRFWKLLGPTMEAPVYGADMEGSLFDGDPACGWNVQKLDSCLQLFGQRLPGVTSPYLYFGMWASVFCAHTEDMNLLSINYLHAGAPKYWYAIAPEDSKRFESLMACHFAESARNCPEFLRHKRNLLSPAILKKAGICFTTQVQRPGDAIITFPGSYHFGFNTGFNVAESTNFGIPEWISSGMAATVCICRPHSVRIDMDMFQSLLKRYEDDARRSRRVGYRHVSYRDWIDREKEKQESESSDGGDNDGDLNGAEVVKKKKKQKGFVAEVVRPLSGKVTSKKRALPLAKSSKEVEDWRLARKVFRGSIAPQTKVLCFMVENDADSNDEINSSQCFAGVVSEVVDDHVRIHFAGTKRKDDVWMPTNSPKLFLDGGSKSPPGEELGNKEKRVETASRKKCRA